MPSKDPDIRYEPHLQKENHSADSAIDRPLGLVSNATPFSPQSDEDIDHSVWDEPSLVPAAVENAPENALTYENWLTQRRDSWSQWQAWVVTFGIILLSVPCAFVAAVASWISTNQFVATDVVVACIGAPILQEIFKIMIPLWVVEKRPYLFTSWFQFFVFALASATIFTAMSNFFLSLTVNEITIAFFIFQWVGILGLNLVTSSIATFGLETIWRRTINTGKPPKLEHGYPYIATAIGLHIAFAIGCTTWFVAADIGKMFFL